MPKLYKKGDLFKCNNQLFRVRNLHRVDSPFPMYIFQVFGKDSGFEHWLPSNFDKAISHCILKESGYQFFKRPKQSNRVNKMRKQSKPKTFVPGDIFSRGGQVMRIRSITGTPFTPVYIFQLQGTTGTEKKKRWLTPNNDIKVPHEDFLSHPFKVLRKIPLQLSLFD